MMERWIFAAALGCVATCASAQTMEGVCGGSVALAIVHANGKLTAWFNFNASHELTREVVQCVPTSEEARSVGMFAQWEATAPATIDWNRGLVTFDSRRLWDNPAKRPPGGLTLEMRATQTAPWAGYAAMRGKLKLQYGVRLAADWADVHAFARGAETVYLLNPTQGGHAGHRPAEPVRFRVPDQ